MSDCRRAVFGSEKAENGRLRHGYGGTDGETGAGRCSLTIHAHACASLCILTARPLIATARYVS